MAINIHFFTRNKSVDYEAILEYFDELPNFSVFFTGDYCEAICNDPEFDFTYRYLITRHSRVTNISDLNPEFININFMLEMPILIPSFLAKEILNGALKVCKQFDLEVYHEKFDDIKPFNVVDMLGLFESMRTQFIENHGIQGKVMFESDKLDVIFKYQRSIETIKSGMKEDVNVSNCFPVVNYVEQTNGLAYQFKLGEATVLPPYIDYLYIITDEGTYLVERNKFEHLFSKFFDKLDEYLPDLYWIKSKNARRLKLELRKIQKVSIDASNFIPLHLCDVIEA